MLVNDIEQLIIQPDTARIMINELKTTSEKAGIKVQSILLWSSILRCHLRQLTMRFIPGLVILSASEVPGNVNFISPRVVE